MWWIKSIKPFQAKAVAYYRHSAQDRQENSIPIQREQVRKFAHQHGIQIIHEFADHGKSGLSTEGRDEFKKMLEMVKDINIEFKYILVLDMSRWGRFQDIDLSAHYRTLCKKYGRTVIYTKVGFQKDDDPMYFLQLNFEGIRAASYSRELSEKVFLGCKKIAEQGFHPGGLPPYGTQRVLLDERKQPLHILKRGQRKSIQNQRVTLKPGDEKEQDTVKRIFLEFTCGKRDSKEIADSLNKDSIPSPTGKKWRKEMILLILTNEAYIGTITYNKTTSRLQSRTRKNPEYLWVRTSDAFTPIVDKETFYKAQELVLQERKIHELRHTKEDMLDKLRDLYRDFGFISARNISKRKDMLSLQYYISRFVTLDAAFQNMFPDVLNKTKESVKKLLTLSTIKIEDYHDYLVLNDTLSILIQPSVPVPCGYGVYWSFQVDSRLEIDVTLGVPLSSSNECDILGYMFFPRIMTQNRSVRLFDSSDGTIEQFGYNNLEMIKDVIL